MSTDRDFERARQLDAAGRDDQAARAYLALLERDPAHFGALTNLANLMERRGFTAAARQGYREAARFHPDNPVAHTNFGASLLDAGELEAARVAFERALELAPENEQAHQGLSAIFARLGDDAAAQLHRALGFRESVVHQPFHGDGTAPNVIVLLSAGGGNVDLRQFLDDRRYDLWKIFVDAPGAPGELPPHDLVVNAIGDAERSGDALERAAQLVASSASVINAPEAVLQTSRLGNAERFAGIPGVRVPRVQLVRRDALRAFASSRDGSAFLLRSPGHHSGEHFVRIETAAQLDDEVARLPGSELLAIDYLDVRGSDGKFRKYRIMTVGGKLYPLHLAISSHWKVHYFSSQTLSEPSHRAEEERFLDDAAGALGSTPIAALEAVAGALKLDYAGIDFSLDPAGKVVVFEANATMTIPRLSEAPADYRKPALERACKAVEGLLSSRAQA